MVRKKASEAENSGEPPVVQSDQSGAVENPEPRKKNGGWQAVEALREKAALKASLADVWDEDFDLDEEILAELDHTAEFFTAQEDSEDEVFDEDENIDEFLDDDQV